MSTTLTAPAIVPSYVRDEWWAPEPSEGAMQVVDATTGEPIATVSTDGLDTAGAVEHARTVGQRSLGEMSLHQRALRLKEIALVLQENKQRLYEVSYRTGATDRDNGIDIDGGIGTLFTFSSKGRRELPDSAVIIDGGIEPLSRDGSFIGEHLYTRLPGVAVQINAFNFPVWGMLEKFAPAFIAGVPSLVKPASQTGYLTAECVKIMVESGLLPEGSLQLISGSARDLMDHLDHRDLVSFTGSAGTAERLTSHPAVTQGGLRFTAETDSLNAAILGPDATPDTPEFEAFIKSVFTEMTAKAGQKCTAIRRVIVPAERVEDVVSALDQKLNRVVMGDPREEGTTMGSLVSTGQCEEVAGNVERLIAAGGKLRIGGLEGSPSETAFMPPTVLTFEDPNTPEVHDVEAFGPVTSVIGYQDLQDAIRLAALGQGSLVATVCTHDPAVAATLVTGIAAHHGRVLILDRDDAKTSTGHGSPVPHLIHGGPGRAGGGEELGGVRAVKHHMQRTAVQGSPDMLTALTGVWHPGAATRSVTRDDVDSKGGVHPFRRSLESLRVGDQFESELRKVTLDDITHFAEFTGDTFYAHTDEEAATANPFFPRRVAHGYLLLAWAAGLFVDPAPGPVLANYGLDDARFLTPVTYDDSVRVTLTCQQITPRVTGEYGEVRWHTVLHNQDDEIVATYTVLTMVALND